ncbi:MAG: sigma-54-dependent Fis family transcriptional regulator [Polyangiaceae bacterium]|nr:sigma-54-dependent Fis family transcriptional regulator [Polyangiaceae bacterium]
MGHQILVVDDDEAICDLITRSLARLGHGAKTASTAEEALELVSSTQFDAVFADIGMTGMDGLELCRRLHDKEPELSVVMVTGDNSLQAAVSSLRAGAYDFIVKPIEDKLLCACVLRAAQATNLKRQVRGLRNDLDIARPQGTLLGDSSAMRRVQDLISRVAPSDASVLIVGETGTGKELVARAIHEQSSRSRGPFIALNCAAVPATLIESELFGHARGAFTDAKNAREGLFLEANGGTIFLDEIGEMPFELQAKLLRALQEKTVRPLGGKSEVAFDARIITATNRDLEAEVRAKRFREDLYYRINVVRIGLPPLRERGSDILTIARHLLARTAKDRELTLSTQAAERLLHHDWAGNVRELENCIEHAVALAQYNQIAVDDLPPKLRRSPSHVVVSVEDQVDLVTLDQLETRYIQRVLTLVGGNKSRAATVMGVDRRTLYRKLERMKGILPEEMEASAVPDGP